MIVVVLLSLTIALAVMANLFNIWVLAKQGKKKLMYTTIIVTSIVTIYFILRIVALYNISKSLGI